jgi:thiosulfate/3-mercaptopyruvate sulfurtransferase
MDGPLVTAEWLAAHRDEVVVADVRWYLDGRSGHDAYRRGHIPGAVFVDLNRDLAAEASPEHGRHPLPEPEAFAEAMSALGIGDDTPVVAYDDAGGSTAARLWWMLDATGRSAAILDGGIQAWTGPLASGDEHLPPAHLTPRPWPAERLAGIDDVERLRGDPDAVVLDARAHERYTGESEPVDPRAGHVPGARSAHWALSIDPATGRFRDPDQLREHFAALGADDAEEVVAYCGSGINACHEVLALHVAGVRARLYPGSWSQWSNDPARPAAEGDEPG